LSAALKAEKRTGRTTETDPSVPREEYVYFEGPYIIISDMAEVHKPILVREYPEGSDRADGLWPMFWACKEGNCPFVRPRPDHKPADDAKHYARPNTKPALKENVQIQNKRDQPASGIINSSNAFSAIRSTTCGVTSALSGLGGNVQASLSREVRDLKSRLTPAVIMPPPAKKRKVETLREQLAKTKPKKEKKEGYCENCKDRYDDYQEVRS
jgi:regulatory subunit for Cdc7p protein kinase